MKICNSTSNAFLIRNAVYASMITCNENTICYAYFNKEWKILSFDLNGRNYDYYDQGKTKQIKMTLKQLYLQTIIEEHPWFKIMKFSNNV